jgi:hypothetical protein
MTAPSIQMSYNDMEIRVFWDMDTTGTYASFNLYWSVASTMAGESAVVVGITNTPDPYYSNKQIFYKFKRADIGLTADSVFYMRVKGVSAAGVIDTANPGITKYIPSLSEQLDQNKAVEIHGFDYTNKMWRKVKVGTDGALA